MGVNVISGNKTIEFESNGGSKETLYYAATKRNDGVIAGVLLSSVSVTSSESWCHPSLGSTKENTGKQIIIQCDENTDTTEKTANVYVTYNGKQSSQYLIVKIKAAAV